MISSSSLVEVLPNTWFERSEPVFEMWTIILYVTIIVIGGSF